MRNLSVAKIQCNEVGPSGQLRPGKENIWLNVMLQKVPSLLVDQAFQHLRLVQLVPDNKMLNSYNTIDLIMTTQYTLL